MSTPSYPSTYAYLAPASHHDDMEPDDDFLPLLVALLRNEGGLPTSDGLAQLAYYLSDAQRHTLQQLAAAAGRLDDAAITAEISEAQYHAEKTRRFGTSNPEPMEVPFWTFMVQRGWIAFHARMQFDTAFRDYKNAYSAWHGRTAGGEVLACQLGLPHPGYGPPVWCFDRFGMSLTRLPDGRVLFIAGEHEDWYDYDFCIYNDVIVIDPELRVMIYGYPETVFPPTDFHSATLVGASEVYLIGNLGYPEGRRLDETPVYRLDTDTMQMRQVATGGANPGWISRHQAEYDAEHHAITISGGQIFSGHPGAWRLDENRDSYRLDLTTQQWAHISGGHAT